MSSESSTNPRRHASTSAPTAPQPEEPGNAERVRTLLSVITIGALSTMSRKQEGFPFGSLMPYALDHTGSPLFLISNMAMHTQNLRAEPRASLFVSQPTGSEDALGSARATLVGEARPIPENEVATASEQYLARHPSSRYWVDFADFNFFRLDPVDIYYVGGFGVMGWVEAEDYLQAAPDPLADAASRILAHMNADHVDAMLLLARQHAQLIGAEAQMTSVDRLGFSLRVKTEEGMKGARINFPREVSTAQQTREALVEMTRAAGASPKH